jgi:NAD(P)-dependent dehydrogenase (short-subunit alcohol dehydrogenase family)
MSSSSPLAVPSTHPVSSGCCDDRLSPSSLAALDAGDTVVLTDRRVAGAEDLSAAYPGRMALLDLDVTDPARIDAVVAEAIQRFGRIDVLVNAAGRGHYGAVEETTEGELRSLMELHFFGPAALTKAVLPHMRRQASGAVVQISSLAGQTSSPGFRRTRRASSHWRVWRSRSLRRSSRWGSRC